MISNIVFVFLVVILASDYAYGQKDRKFFRKDYKYLEELESFYKIHTLPKTLFEAKKMCELEGAKMYYPENDKEAQTLLNLWTSTLPNQWMILGISDLETKRAFKTIDGTPISDVYHNWGEGEPNNANGIEDCVIMSRDGTLNDVECITKYSFICKKPLRSLEWHKECNKANLDYIYSEQTGSCYKFHMTPLNWTDAYAVCNAEQTYLAVITSQSEAEYLVGLIERTSAPKKIFKMSYLSGAVHSGFRYVANEGWETMKGIPLEDSGYDSWDDRQPDGDDREQCGSMSYKGRLHDITSDTRSFFICEHDVNKH